MMCTLMVAVVLISSCKKPVACFEISSESIDDGNNPSIDEQITFDNCSEDAESYSWDFGDGESSTSISPRHEYDEDGRYTITLTATAGNATDEVSQTIDVVPNLTGDWEGTMYLESDPFGILMELEQEGTELSGTWSFDDGSGLANLDSSSEVDGNDVTINFTVPVYGIEFEYEGEINDDFDEMEGTYVSTMGSSVITGTWEAEKVSSKSAGKAKINKGLKEFILQMN